MILVWFNSNTTCVTGGAGIVNTSGLEHLNVHPIPLSFICGVRVTKSFVVCVVLCKL